MSVLAFAEGDSFIFRTFKSMGAPWDYAWSNAYEMHATSSGTDAALLSCAYALINFEKEFHALNVQFDRVGVATWTPDSRPYDPENFMVVPLSDTMGLRTVMAPEGLELTLFVRRQVQTGRMGKLFYRGVLGEADVEQQGRFWKLSDRSAMAGEIADAITASQLDYYFAGTTVPLRFGLIAQYGDPPAMNYRPVTAFEVAGAVTCDLKRPWYNRVQPEP